VAKFMPLFMFMAKFMPVMPLVMEECRNVINGRDRAGYEYEKMI